MDVFLSTMLNNINSNGASDMSGVGPLSLADFLPQNVKLETGQTLLLTLDGQGNMLLQNETGELVNLPQNVLRLNKNIPQNTTLELTVKISNIQNQTAEVQVVNMKISTDKTNINQSENSSLIIKDISQPQNIVLKPVNLNEIAQPLLQKLNLPPEQRAKVQTALQQVEIKTQIANISESPNEPMSPKIPLNTETGIYKNIKTVLEKLPTELASQPLQSDEIIQNRVQELVNQLQPFVGEKIPAKVTNNVFKTNLGFIRTQLPIQLPEELMAELDIVSITNQTKRERVAAPSDNLVHLMQTLKNESPNIYRLIASKLPADNQNMLVNMTAFTKAATTGDLKKWLGEETIRQIENQGSIGKTVLKELQQTLDVSSRQTPTWRTIEIPYYIENQMEKIKLAIKQYPDEEDTTENPRQKFGTRFVVDTNFTKLGAFQFDGFSFAKDRRFDLIIRTEKYIDDDLCSNMMRLFKTSLNDVEYVGNIKINLKENFIKISENTTEDNILTQGMFI